MKVLMLTDLYLPVSGGGERHVQSLSRRLAGRGHEVSVCTIGSPGLPEFEEEGGVRLYRLEGIFQKIPLLYRDQMKRWHPPTPDWLVTKKIKRLLLEDKPDIIHAHGRIAYSALPLRAKLNIPLVVTLHGYWPVCPLSTLMRRDEVCTEPFTVKCVACSRQYGLVKSLFSYLGTIINRTELKQVDRFIAVSSFVKEVHVKYLGLNDEDIVVIPNFYAADDDTAQAGAGGDFPEDFILFVGTLIPHKGVDILIEAYRALNTKAKLVLIGASHLDYRYEGTDDIILIENAPHSLVREAYQSCRFAVFPSTWHEPCATVAFEAMSYKKAIIVSEMGGFAEIVVAGETGIIVPPHDAGALARAMEYLLQVPQVAEEMGRRGYERWRQSFGVEAVVPQIEQLYKSLLS